MAFYSLLTQLFFITTLLSPTITNTIVSHAYEHCREHEKALLLELKNELVFDSSYSTKLVQWNKWEDCCRWKGVECDGAGRVISLQLDSEAISGGLNDSSSLFSLEYLEKLNLAYNALNSQSPFPRGIENLTYLMHLNLSFAGFDGGVPIEISQLRRLVSLDLSHNGWNECPSLGVLLRNLTRLKHLYLDGIDLSTEGSNWCNVISTSLPDLTSLSLHDCNLSAPLDRSLSHLRFLSILQLDGNNLSTAVPELFDFGSFSSLTTLSLAGCSLKGYFPEKIFQVPTLQFLDLVSNPLLSGTIPQFPQITSFRTIILSETNFSGSLPVSISNLKNLSHIDLSGCRFSGLIPSASLSNLTELVSVDLSRNFFTGSISSMNFDALVNLVSLDLHSNSLTGIIPKSIFALLSLTDLDLKNNHFSGQINEFPTVNISNLLWLDLSSNRLEGPIPGSIFQLESLESLWLFDNLFNNTLEQKKSPSLPNISNLDLSNNQLSGEIPSWIWEIGKGPDNYVSLSLNLSCNMLVDLQKPFNISTSNSFDILDLHSNQLRGELPPQLQQASYADLSNNFFDKFIPITGNFSAPCYLLSLSLANNSLSGSFPSFIGECDSLRALDLSANSLSGSIPLVQFPAIETFTVLNLGRNNLSGRIPNSFSPDCHLKTMDLSYNDLVGQLPPSLAKCNDLEVLNVENNQIDDIFPCMLRPSLMVLVLRSNKFHGEVKCHRSWPNLQIIDLASNNLTGYLNPSIFSGWKGMRQNSFAMLSGYELGVIISRDGYYYRDEVTLIIKGLARKLAKISSRFTAIDFSCNNFQGDIPDSIAELNGLHLLNLSHNSLTGRIPKSFRNLTVLESLDLSVNQLTGEIPMVLAGLTFLSIMNLSHNKLVGKIPVGSQIQTFSPDSFEGNMGLCGLPLNISCTNTPLSPPEMGSSVQSLQGETSEIEWDYVFAAAGYVVGLGSIAWILLCCRGFRDKYFEKIEDVFEKIFDRRQHRKRRHGATTRVVRNHVARQQ